MTWHQDVTDWVKNYYKKADPAQVKITEELAIRKGWEPSKYQANMRSKLHKWLTDWYTLSIKSLTEPATKSKKLKRRNPIDEGFRKKERASELSGTVADKALTLRNQMQKGEISPIRVALAASYGDEVANEIFNYTQDHYTCPAITIIHDYKKEQGNVFQELSNQEVSKILFTIVDYLESFSNLPIYQERMFGDLQTEVERYFALPTNDLSILRRKGGVGLWKFIGDTERYLKRNGATAPIRQRYSDRSSKDFSQEIADVLLRRNQTNPIDEDLRKAERDAMRSGLASDDAVAIQNRLRAGQITPLRVAAASLLDDKGAEEVYSTKSEKSYEIIHGNDQIPKKLKGDMFALADLKKAEIFQIIDIIVQALPVLSVKLKGNTQLERSGWLLGNRNFPVSNCIKHLQEFKKTPRRLREMSSLFHNTFRALDALKTDILYTTSTQRQDEINSVNETIAEIRSKICDVLLKRHRTNPTPDDQLRKAERSDDETKTLIEKLRTGIVTEDAVNIAAKLGSPIAISLVGIQYPEPATQWSHDWSGRGNKGSRRHELINDLYESHPEVLCQFLKQLAQRYLNNQNRFSENLRLQNSIMLSGILSVSKYQDTKGFTLIHSSLYKLPNDINSFVDDICSGIRRDFYGSEVLWQREFLSRLLLDQVPKLQNNPTPDDSLRKAERENKISQDPEALRKKLIEKLRTGQISEDNIKIAARIGSPVAKTIMGWKQDTFNWKSSTVRNLIYREIAIKHPQIIYAFAFDVFSRNIRKLSATLTPPNIDYLRDSSEALIALKDFINGDISSEELNRRTRNFSGGNSPNYHVRMLNNIFNDILNAKLTDNPSALAPSFIVHCSDNTNAEVEWSRQRIISYLLDEVPV